MSLCRYLARRVPGFRLQSVRGAVGAREAIFRDYSPRPWRAYEGPLLEHTIMLVEAGTAVLERNGALWEARAGDALLIPSGGDVRLQFKPCPVREELAIDVIVFDARSLGGILRQFATWENFALEDSAPPAAFHFTHFHRSFDTGRELSPHTINRYHHAISALLLEFRPGLAGFLRDAFYRRRWEVAIFMERFVIHQDGVRSASAQYAGGAGQLRRDCQLYLGAEPGAVLARRRCELATAWLRCGHSIEKVAQTLGYSTTWIFETEFSGVTKRRCRHVQRLTPLAEAEPEELILAMQPFWWSDRKLLMDRPKPKRLFQEIMSVEEEAAHIALDLELTRLAQENRTQRQKITEDLRERVVDFLAMKTTGSKMIVPIFKFAAPTAVAA